MRDKIVFNNRCAQLHLLLQNFHAFVKALLQEGQRESYQKPALRRYQRLGDAVGHKHGVLVSVQSNHLEGGDHAGHRPEQPEKRRGRCHHGYYMVAAFHVAHRLCETHLHVVAESFGIFHRDLDGVAKLAREEAATLAQAAQRLFRARGLAILLVFFVTAVQVETHALDDLVDVLPEKVAPNAEPTRKQVIEPDYAREENREHHDAARLVRILQRLDEYVEGVIHASRKCGSTARCSAHTFRS